MIYPNEPAFPVEEHDSCGNPVRENYGITKREYFIASILKGLCANPASDGVTEEDIAKCSIRVADAVIKELEAEN